MTGGSVSDNIEILQALILCRVCGNHKSFVDFYNRQVRSDLSAGECKSCTKTRVKNRSRTNPSVQEYDRERAKTPSRRAKTKEITRKWREDNPMGYLAHTAVSTAIRAGRLQKMPCVFCSEKIVHAHHKDYSKPLDVIWLCPKCHHRLHALFPEIEGKGKGAE